MLKALALMPPHISLPKHDRLDIGGLARVVRESLKRGADPSHIDRNGRTPVFEAAYHGHVEALSILCDSSADTGVGWTAAHTGLAYTAREIALLRGNSDVVQVSG